jgi:hypothetical protein
MKWTYAKYGLLGGTLTLSALGYLKSQAQDAEGGPAAPSSEAFGPGGSGNFPPMVHPRDDRQEEVRQAIAKFKSPRSNDQEKKEAKEKITTYLRDVYQRDQKHRRDQIARLEAQLDRLKKQVEKHDAAQGKMIDLRIQMLETEADGLSFPDSWMNLSGPGAPIPMPGPWSPGMPGMQPGLLGMQPGSPGGMPGVLGHGTFNPEYGPQPPRGTPARGAPAMGTAETVPQPRTTTPAARGPQAPQNDPLTFPGGESFERRPREGGQQNYLAPPPNPGRNGPDSRRPSEPRPARRNPSEEGRYDGRNQDLPDKNLNIIPL